ncbi:MmgE/PrpD family protein [Pararoseomonas indoligenes]|uniref:MmgE/PrpD family protein n=1 Tax=Roseomonas indoligenes TaxID=2820811 RepID=A0A940S7U0_9PROT|nr:MmgE/PrpD family protein [Pararoseomonas indoligenes]MBP0495404.1 MmgE/PrpD family protein [Pararoseomonas indoligenes]
MSVTEPQAATRCLAAHVAGLNATDLVPEERVLVARAVLDTVAVGVAARDEPAARLAVRRARAQGEGPCTLWTASGALHVREEEAAWANGVMAHVLDFDDVTSVMRGHPSVAMLPAVLALAEAEGLSVSDVTAAYVAGFEVIAALSAAMATPHYARGWHSTATIGAIGAAAACARLLRLDEMRVAHAIGLAVTQAAGTRASFGTMAKSVQAGNANLTGLRAARLAEIGFDAAPDALGGALGFAQLGGGGTLALPEARDARALLRHGLEVKKYPLCYATHRALDAVLDLRAAHGLALPDVEAVHVHASPGALAPLIHHRPTTGLDAKFSMEYAMAAALEDGALHLASFEDAAVRRPVLQAFLSHVTADEAVGALLPRWAEVTLRLKDGRVLSTRQDALRGGAEDPLSEGELLAKAAGCFAHGGGAATGAAALLSAFEDPHRAAGPALREALTGAVLEERI